jgi:hypothetical protein
MSNPESPAPIRSPIARALAALYAGWLWIRERMLVLKPCRVAIVMVFAGLAFLFADQGQDVLRALAEHRTGDRNHWQPVVFFGAVLAWSLYAWYWARVMLYLEFPGIPDSKGRRAHRQRKWTPRLLGFVAALGVAAALHFASRGYAEGEGYAKGKPEGVEALLHSYAYWCLIGAVAFLIAVSVRRQVSRFLYSKLTRARVPTVLQTPAENILNVSRSEDEVYGALKLTELSALTGALLGFALGAAMLLFLAFISMLQTLAPVMGSASILLLAAAGWIAVGSMLDFIGMRLRFPVFLALVLLAVAFSWWNDNHAVRTLDAPQAAQREPLRAALRSWLSRQPAQLAGPDEKYPMYVVNAEGGGIRAAYWTSTVLGEIQKRNPCFADQLFSLSGVSGGSLGASVFLALLVESRAAVGAARRCDDAAAPARLDIKGTAQAILSEDFLSPVVAGVLYPDLVQRALFWPIERFDRAVALEEAWERAWRLNAPGANNRLAQPFDRLWDDRTRWTPALFLNATWVETGKRLIVSNVAIAPRPGDADAADDFVDVEDAQRFFAPRGLRLSTAVHMSARFTYVSPAGTLVRDGRVHGRVVDGGYFENSGATTTLEILKTIDPLIKEDRRWAKVEPIVIHISNDAVDPAEGPGTLLSAPKHPAIAPTRLLNEVRSPISTLFNTRGARGVYARDTLYWHVGGANFLHFGLCRRSDNAPLGWALSKSTRGRMEEQLHKSCPEDAPDDAAFFKNAANLKAIDARLRRPAGAAPDATQAGATK